MWFFAINGVLYYDVASTLSVRGVAAPAAQPQRRRGLAGWCCIDLGLRR